MPVLFGRIQKRFSDSIVFVIDSSRGDARELGLIGELPFPREEVVIGYDHESELDKLTLTPALAHKLARTTQPCD